MPTTEQLTPTNSMAVRTKDPLAALTSPTTSRTRGRSAAVLVSPRQVAPIAQPQFFDNRAQLDILAD